MKQKILVLDSNILINVLLSDEDDANKYWKESGINVTPENIKSVCKSLQKHKIIVTPHILTEVSNQIENKLHGEKYRQLMKESISALEKFGEEYVKKDEILSQDMFLKFGFADCSLYLAIKNLMKNETIGNKDKKAYILVTSDRGLLGFCTNNGIEAYSVEYLYEEI